MGPGRVETALKVGWPGAGRLLTPTGLVVVSHLCGVIRTKPSVSRRRNACMTGIRLTPDGAAR